MALKIFSQFFAEMTKLILALTIFIEQCDRFYNGSGTDVNKTGVVSSSRGTLVKPGVRISGFLSYLLH